MDDMALIPNVLPPGVVSYARTPDFTPENLPARELAMRRFRQRAEVHVLPVMANHNPGETTLVTKTQVIYGV